MEMQQGFHSVIDMNAAAPRDQEQLHPSSHSSPDHQSSNSSISSAPAALSSLSPPLLQAHTVEGAHDRQGRMCSSSWPPARREQALKSLAESIPHSMKLRQLKKSERGHQKDASWHKRKVRRLSKEVYVIVSWYAVLQGALFTAVAQTSVFTCEDWWGPAGIVGAVTLGTMSGVLDKLRFMAYEKQEVKNFQRRQSAVYDRIEQIYTRGAACNIDALDQPPAHPSFDAAHHQAAAGFNVCIFSPQALLVFAFLLGFSALMVASCTRMLCHGCPCRKPPTP